MKLTSPIFSNNGNIPLDYSCIGKKQYLPDLFIEGVPSNAKELLLFIYDPDAPNGKSDTQNNFVYYHGAFFLSPSTLKVENGLIPSDVQIVHDYEPPCPPFGVHRYYFELFALDTDRNYFSGASVNNIKDMIKEHIIESAELIGEVAAQTISDL